MWGEFMKNFFDRMPAEGKANRKLITPESGEAFYASVVCADEATEAGTPINRASMMALQGFLGKETVFSSDGSITETNSEGDILRTVFNSDGSITESFTSGLSVITKKTVFNSDGSITESII